MSLDDDAGACVSERRVLFKLRAHFGDRWSRPHRFHSVPNFAELRRVMCDFLEEAFVVNARAFGAAADERKNRIHQHMIRHDHRGGSFGDYDVFQSFAEDLFHEGEMLSRELNQSWPTARSGWSRSTKILARSRARYRPSATRCVCKAR